MIARARGSVARASSRSASGRLSTERVSSSSISVPSKASASVCGATCGKSYRMIGEASTSAARCSSPPRRRPAPGNSGGSAALRVAAAAAGVGSSTETNAPLSRGQQDVRRRRTRCAARRRARRRRPRSRSRPARAACAATRLRNGLEGDRQRAAQRPALAHDAPAHRAVASRSSSSVVPPSTANGDRRSRVPGTASNVTVSSHSAASSKVRCVVPATASDSTGSNASPSNASTRRASTCRKRSSTVTRGVARRRRFEQHLGLLLGGLAGSGSAGTRAARRRRTASARGSSRPTPCTDRADSLRRARRSRPRAPARTGLAEPLQCVHRALSRSRAQPRERGFPGREPAGALEAVELVERVAVDADPGAVREERVHRRAPDRDRQPVARLARPRHELGRHAAVLAAHENRAARMDDQRDLAVLRARSDTCSPRPRSRSCTGCEVELGLALERQHGRRDVRPQQRSQRVAVALRRRRTARRARRTRRRRSGRCCGSMRTCALSVIACTGTPLDSATRMRSTSCGDAA